MSRKSWRLEKAQAARTSSTDPKGMATWLRCASSNISSGSSDPSIWRCSSALGSAAMNAARASREAKSSGTGHVLLAQDDRGLGLVAADFLGRQAVDLVREDQPPGGFGGDETETGRA